MKRRVVFFPSIFLCLAIATLFGQDAGSINGRIADPQHGAGSGVQVMLQNNGAGFVREALSAHDGSYAFPTVVIGSYTVTVDAKGFKKSIAQDVRAELAQRVQLDLALEEPPPDTTPSARAASLLAAW